MANQRGKPYRADGPMQKVLLHCTQRSIHPVAAQSRERMSRTYKETQGLSNCDLAATLPLCLCSAESYK